MKACDYCGAPHPTADDGMAPCPSCGAVTDMVILAKYTQGLQPMFRRTLLGRIKRGIWINPATGERDVMTEREFQSLREVGPSDGQQEETEGDYPDTDLTWQALGNRETIEAEVNAAMAAKQQRLDRIEAVLASLEPDVSDERVRKVVQERHHLRTFFWLARGGDERREPFPNPSEDMSLEEVDLLAKVRALDDTA